MTTNLLSQGSQRGSEKEFPHLTCREILGNDDSDKVIYISSDHNFT
jgi:hypothetical protein